MVAAPRRSAALARGWIEHAFAASVQFRPMGVLDDAIREHLDLKRKHGAAEDELERQEEEALGPARREVEQESGDAEPEATPEAEEVADEVAAEPEAAAEEVEPPDEEAEAAEAPTEFVDHASLTLEAEPEEPQAQPALTEDPPDPAPERRDDQVDSWFEEDEPPADEAAEEAEADASAKDGDVLEDTPDFLQETPEHDRLWFEQKPPRDFDFD